MRISLLCLLLLSGLADACPVAVGRVFVPARRRAAVVATSAVVAKTVIVPTATLVVPAAISTVIVQDVVGVAAFAVPAYGSSFNPAPAAKATDPAATAPVVDDTMKSDLESIKASLKDVAAALKTLNDNQLALEKRLKSLEEKKPPAKVPPMPKAKDEEKEP